MKWILLIGFISLAKIHTAQSFSLDGFRHLSDSVYLSIAESGKGEKVTRGDYVLLRTEFLTGSDSLVFDSGIFNDGPVEYRVDNSDESPLVSGLLKLREGDSAIIAFPARLIYTDIKPGYYHEGLWMKYRVSIFRSVDSVTRSLEKEKARALQTGRDSDTILSYLMDHGMKAPYRTPGSVFIAWHKRGQGLSPRAGDYISLHYRGYLLNGETFDDSWKREEPFRYVIGEMKLIEGWREAITYLTEGDSVTIAIPSPLAYGAQGAGGTIPPNSILFFDLKLLEANNETFQFGKDTTAIERYLRQHGQEARKYDNGVAISIIDSGAGAPLETGALVTLQYQAKVLKGQIVEDHWEEPRKFRMNTGSIPPGLEFALGKLTVGTRAQVLVPSRLAYGAMGDDDTTANAVLVYKLTVLQQE